VSLHPRSALLKYYRIALGIPPPSCDGLHLAGRHVPARLQAWGVERWHKLALKKMKLFITLDDASDTGLTIFMSISCRVNGLLKTFGYDGSFPSLKLKDTESWLQSLVRQPDGRPFIQVTPVGEDITGHTLESTSSR